MSGGAGNDTYIVDHAGDTVVETAGDGTDTVRASVSYGLSANVENLELTGAGDLDGYGNALANSLRGNSGSNVLDGGAGADNMAGGAGNDTYWVDDAGDTVIEKDNEGDDTVRASVDFTLSANVENLTLIGTGSLNGTGNGAANILIGNAGSNILDGGAGADHMSGGAGDDTYVVDNAGDTIVENAASGTDTVRASVSFALSANVETLILTGGADLDGTGNGLANTIVGNAGRNLLDGGTGADQLIGGAGDDIYSNT